MINLRQLIAAVVGSGSYSYLTASARDSFHHSSLKTDLLLRSTAVVVDSDSGPSL